MPGTYSWWRAVRSLFLSVGKIPCSYAGTAVSLGDDQTSARAAIQIMFHKHFLQTICLKGILHTVIFISEMLV